MKRLASVLVLGAMVFCISACAIVAPLSLRKDWKWDGVLRVMPNSIFEPVAKARPADAQPGPVAAMPSVTMREELSLDGVWRYCPDAQTKGERENWFAPDFNDSSWKTMRVPNNFTIDDTSLKNFYKPVWFRTSFDLPASFSNKNLRLKFEGVDYFAKVWLNGKLLGEHEGYFNPFAFNVTELAKPGKNALVVKVTNPWDFSIKAAEITSTSASEKIWINSVMNFHDSRMGGGANSAVQSQSFGTGGIVQPVKLVATGGVAIDWMLVTPRLSENYTKAEVTFDVFLTNFSTSPLEAVVQVDALGENFSGYKDSVAMKATVAPGPNKVSLTLKVRDPKLWWPYSHPELGQPNLYRANAAVFAGAKASDAASHIFGLKEIKLTESGPQAYFWFVNGKRLSFRGTNGIPTEYFSRYTPQYLDDYFRKLKESNMDVLIVHDHQEPQLIYDKADQEGMVILQNFTLIWGFSPCDFVRPNGDPQLTNNEQVIGRMAVEAMWYLYNHPSIFWWSMHDESFHIEFGERNFGNVNFCKRSPYKQGDFIAQFNDAGLNLNLDNQVLKIAHAANPTLPVHRTGGKSTDSTTYHGWYTNDYWGLIKDPKQFPLEFGTESVPYSMAGTMTYLNGWFPITSSRAITEWEYHGLQFPVMQNYIGRTESYDNFNDWAFASQLYQAVVNKYHIEINRENKYHPTGSVLQWMYNEWWPSVNFGMVDWNLEDRLARAWIKQSFAPVLAATRVARNIYSSGEKIEIPIHLMNDEYNSFPGARLSWRIVEETDSFFIVGMPKEKGRKSDSSKDEQKSTAGGALATLVENMLRQAPKHTPVTAAIGHGVPVAEAAKGEFKVDLLADSQVVAGIVKFDAPQTAQPRHYTIYLTLASADGKILCENFDHFVVVADAKKFMPGEGISPQPRFDLELKLAKDGKPFKGSAVSIVDKYNPALKYEAALDGSGAASVKSMLPGAYRLSVEGNTYEFLVNRDEKLEVNFVPGLNTTMGTPPLIEWKDTEAPKEAIY